MALSNPQSSVTELSIADIQARFAQGLLTCTELTQRLLQRIERYDKQGPGLKASTPACAVEGASLHQH